MASYGPGIGNYGRRPSLGAGIGRGLSSLADRLREIEGQKIRANEIAGERAFETERDTLRFNRDEESSLARELRAQAAEESRFNRGEQSDIAREDRGVARETAQRERVLGGLGSGLRNSVRGLNSISNADQTVAPGTFEDFDATQSLLASGDEGLMRRALDNRLNQPGEDARELGMFRQKALIDRQINPPQYAPRAVQTEVLADGTMVRVGQDGSLTPMTLPDGTTARGRVPGSTTGGTGSRMTTAQLKAQTFLTMAQDAAEKLDQFGAPSVRDAAAGNTPFIGNMLMSDDGQLREQSGYQLADAWLRFTSGAAVPETEVERYARTFTPRLGDNPNTLRVKSQARQKILEALRTAAGTQTQPDDLNEIDPDILDALRGP